LGRHRDPALVSAASWPAGLAAHRGRDPTRRPVAVALGLQSSAVGSAALGVS